MKLTVKRETLLKPLQQVSGVVEKRQTLPILANVLLDARTNTLSITGTDLEVWLEASVELTEPPHIIGRITVPGKKLIDICRNLPENASITLQTTDRGKLTLQSGKSRFSLSTLPADEFPEIEQTEGALEFTIPQNDLLHLLQSTAFAMAQQDVRYYLNGMLLEAKDGKIRTVATDGHRLALNSISLPVMNNMTLSVIAPRKGVVELTRLLESNDMELTVLVTANHVRVVGPNFTFTSKLIDGNFPDYNRVIPKGGDKEITVDKALLKQSLTRASILTNEKVRGVRLQFRKDLLRILANNPEQEEAEEEIPDLHYPHAELDIGFNVNYLLDILNIIPENEIKVTFANPDSSVLFESPSSDGSNLFVIMPMRL